MTILSLALAALLGSALPADQPEVCALLTAAEVGGAVGVTVGPSSHHEDVMPAGPLKDQPRRGCSWSIGAKEDKDRTHKGIVLLNFVPIGAASGPAGLAVEFRRGLVTPQTGWKTEEVAVGQALCIITTTDVKSAGTWTGCSLAARGRMFSIEARGYPVHTTPQKLKALLDTAASRLPER